MVEALKEETKQPQELMPNIEALKKDLKTRFIRYCEI
jgi:hypothetical protein